MPIETDLSVSPYFDDFDENKNYHKILFKPSVAVQTRELNQLQTILQKQIEVFGNNIFKRGTIIDGCNFNFIDNYPYVKIKDALVSGDVAIPTEYIGYYVKNSKDLRARIIDAETGFESADPDLKTLYLNYINSGNSFNETKFSAGEVLTITDSNDSVYDYTITDAGTGYANNDTVQVTPVLVANVKSGSFNVGDQITDTITGANGVITSITDFTTRDPIVKLSGSVEVNSGSADVTGTSTAFTSDFANGDFVALYSAANTYTIYKINVVTSATVMNLTSTVDFSNTTASYANTTSSEVFIQYRPVSTDLSDSSKTANNWTFTSGNTIQGASASDTAEILSKIGQNASAEIITNSVGAIIDFNISNRGTGYFRQPYASVKSTTGTGATIVAQNYIGQATVASVANAVGSGYAFSVTSGYIYHKGSFVKVQPQTVIVDKYSRSPNNVSVAFETQEDIVNSNEDTTLVDNALGSPNVNAPGADRLKLIANLVTFETSNSVASDTYFTLAEWSNGRPYKQNQYTQFNSITDEMALRTSETDGNYVVDRFLVTSTSPANSSLEGNSFNIVVDPGTAYIDGYRVQTLGNFVYTAPKATGTKNFESSKLSINYENYVRVKELGGFFEFDQANLIDLYDTAKTYLSNNASVAAGNTDPTGTKIGTARIRNFTHEQGVPGDPDAAYRLYLFDIKMNTGRNLREVRAIHYNGTTDDGIADTILENDPTTNTNVAKLYGKNNKLVFNTNYGSLKNANNVNFIYRTIDTQQMSNTGSMTVSVVSIGKNFPYTGTLTDAQKRELYVAPKANLVAYDSLGTVSTTASSTTVTGSGTSFLSDIKAGEYIQVTDGGSNTEIKRVVAVTNNISLAVDSNVSFNSTANASYQAWPMNVPIDLAYNSKYSVSVNGTEDVLTIDLRADTSNGFDTSTDTDMFVGYNVESDGASAQSKTVNRDVYVKLQLSNNAATDVGPWCLGVPDIFRLKGVWKGSSASVTESDLNVTSEFYIDHNQTSNFYDLGYLYLTDKSNLRLSRDDFLLVKFDCFTASPGFYNITSYVSSNTSERTTEDSKSLSELTDTINTLEIPEVFDDAGNYYDLGSAFDFRPYVQNTATLSTTTAGSTLNPANTFTFSASDRFFPVPDSVLTYNADQFVSRRDRIIVDKSGRISSVEGDSETNRPRPISAGSLLLNELFVPAYPSLPTMKSNNLKDILDTRVINQRYTSTRNLNYEVKTLFVASDLAREQPVNYTQEDIGNLERRIRDIEYYVSFNFLQNQVKDRVIPSSVSPTINRFKYGFFVDEYETELFSEVFSPEYDAFVTGTHVEPSVLNLNIAHSNNDISSTGFSNQLIINQPLATVDQSNVCQCNSSNISTSNAELKQIYATQANTGRYTAAKLGDEPPQYITMGTSSSNATLWFHMYSGKDQIFIYQGNTLILTGDDAVKISDAEKTELAKDPFFTGRAGIGSSNTRLNNGSTSGSAGNNYVRYSGKISWTHNPSLGRNYRIEVKKASIIWRYRIDYYNSDGGNACSCNPVTPPPVNYVGTMTIEPELKTTITRYIERARVGERGDTAASGGDAAAAAGGGAPGPGSGASPGGVGF